MRISRVAWAFAALAVAGCADSEPTDRWSRPDTTYDQFLQDRDACESQAREESQPFILGGQHYSGLGGEVDSGRYFPCMSARGYRQDPKGFTPPSNAIFSLSP
jgi:hypothetical protein